MRRMNYYGAERIGIWWSPWALGAFALRPLSVGIRFRPSRRCAGSAYIRRRDLRADLGEILGRGEIAKGLVGSVVVVSVGESVRRGADDRRSGGAGRGCECRT